MQIDTNNVIFRDDLYPRFKPNQNIIEKYSQSIEQLPPIKINQSNILIDGFHRWKAHQLLKLETITCEIINATEQEVKILAYKTNSAHGMQLNNDEKQKFAREMFGIIPDDEIISVLSIGKTTFYKWTETQRDNQKKERDRKILDLYLRCWTQEKIAGEVGESQKTVSNTIDSFSKNSTDGKITKDFSPYLYNIWNQSRQDKETSHFGAFPDVYMENLLYYHTDIFDVIYDPFAGHGTTVDVCQKWLRRYYCSDKIVKPGREKDILQHNIKDGLPGDLPKPDLVFLDPPYWAQAENKYSNDADDLGNMDLDGFYVLFNTFLKSLISWKIKKIAIVIQPTQWKNNLNWEDHIFKFDKVFNGTYSINARYVLPYSTEQYLPQMVTKAKEEKKCLSTFRDLVVWSIR